MPIGARRGEPFASREFVEHMFDNAEVDNPEPPDARPANRDHARMPGSHRRWVFVPVLFRTGGGWRFGVVEQWICLEGRPWVARIVFGPPTQSPYHQFYDYLHDGAIVPLLLDTGASSPSLIPRSLTPQDREQAQSAPPQSPNQGR
jgi:hypothetical protein